MININNNIIFSLVNSSLLYYFFPPFYNNYIFFSMSANSLHVRSLKPSIIMIFFVYYQSK